MWAGGYAVIARPLSLQTAGAVVARPGEDDDKGGHTLDRLLPPRIARAGQGAPR